MDLIGLTGGIGSGKSTVARLLESHGVTVLDADQLAREAVAPGSVGLQKIIEAFGKKMLDENGELNRKKLGEHIFAYKEARLQLNQIVHPEVARLFAEYIKEYTAAGVKILVYEVPLLFENNLQDIFKYTLLVTLPQEVQLARVKARDHFTLEEAQARIDAQMPLAEKQKQADFILDNSGSEEETQHRLASIWLKIAENTLAST